MLLFDVPYICPIFVVYIKGIRCTLLELHLHVHAKTVKLKKIEIGHFLPFQYMIFEMNRTPSVIDN